jgi:hypothetical protein
MNNKFKNTRIVTFKEDYFSKAGVAKNEAPIYKKGSTHAIHYKLVDDLKEKGAKMEVKNFDEQAYIRRSKEQQAKNRKMSMA